MGMPSCMPVVGNALLFSVLCDSASIEKDSKSCRKQQNLCLKYIDMPITEEGYPYCCQCCVTIYVIKTALRLCCRRVPNFSLSVVSPRQHFPLPPHLPLQTQQLSPTLSNYFLSTQPSPFFASCSCSSWESAQQHGPQRSSTARF